MELKKRWVAVVVIVLVMVGVMQTATIRPSVVMGQVGDDGSDAPYLYYFSNDLNAWVIERADGTDRRLLGQGLMPEGTNAVSNSAWSPSGRWFTWSSATRLAGDPWYPVYENRQYWLTDTLDNSQVSNTDFGSWSPTKDRMLVEDERNYVRLPFFGRALPSWLYYLRYSLMDMEANTKEVVFEHKFADWYTGSQVEWLENGQSILSRYWRYRGDKMDVTFVLRSPNGELTFYRTIADSYTVLPKGVIAHLHHRTLILTDLVHRQNRAIHLDIPDNMHMTSVNWNATGDGVFITAQGSGSIGKSIWWLDLNAPQVHFVGYLVSRSRQANYGLTYQAISPTGRYFAYLDESYRVNYFDSATGQLVRLEIELDQYNVFGDPQFYWTSNDYLIVFAAHGTILESYKSRRVTFIDPATGSVKVLTLGIDLQKPPQLSADGRYLAWMYDGPTILTLNGDIITLPPDSRAIGSSYGGFVRWHPTASWFLAFDDGFQAGGGRGPYFVSAVSADRQIRREIYADSAINWLPENVNPDELPSLPNLPSPVQRIESDTFIRNREAMIWSLDGQLLRTSLGVWDVVNERFVENVNFSLFPPTLAPATWEGLEYVVYSPDERMVVARFPEPSDYPYPAVYDTETGERLFEIPDRVFYQKALFSPDSRYLVIGFAYKPIKIWDTQTWTLVAMLPVSSPALAFSPDGEYLAVGVSWDVEIWRVSDLIGDRE